MWVWAFQWNGRVLSVMFVRFIYKYLPNECSFRFERYTLFCNLKQNTALHFLVLCKLQAHSIDYVVYSYQVYKKISDTRMHSIQQHYNMIDDDICIREKKSLCSQESWTQPSFCIDNKRSIDFNLHKISNFYRTFAGCWAYIHFRQSNLTFHTFQITF